MRETQPENLAGTLLIAEDDPLLMPLLKATFRTSGLRVITAGTGTQALNLARTERPDLMLLDVGLPEMNGYEVCQAIKSDPQTAVIRVVMLTARAGAADQRIAAEAGADTYLTKPFSPAELLDAVSSLLRTDRAT
jgi:two-component system, OmpR family, alkaline phosphatase synthesis response regulator PhoP